MNNRIVDDESIEVELEHLKLVRDAGFMSMSHYDEHKGNVVQGLTTLGSTFSIALGHALAVAELRNSLKILRYWNHLCEQHALLYRMVIAKENSV